MLSPFQSKYQLSNQELADLFGCSLSTIVKWKGNKVSMPLHAMRFLRFCDTYARGNRKLLAKVDDLSDGKVGSEPGGEERLWETFAQLGEGTAGCAVVHWMPDTSIIRATGSFYEALRMPLPSPGRRTWSSFLDDPEQSLTIESEMMEVIQKGKPLRRQRALRTLEGEVLEFDWLDCPVRQSPGSLVSIISVLVNRTTEKNALRASFRYFESIEQLLQGVEASFLIVNPQGMILDESKNSTLFRESLGLSQLGRLADLFPAPKTLSWNRILADRGTASLEYIGRLQRQPKEEREAITFKACLRPIQWKGQPAFLFEYAVERQEASRGSDSSRSLLDVRLDQEDALLLKAETRDQQSIFTTDDDSTWDLCLSLMGKRHGAMRAYVFQTHGPDGELLSNTHEWAAPGIVPQKEALQNGNFSYTPWWRMKMRRGEPVIVSNVEYMPAEASAEKSILSAQGIVGLIAVPILINKSLRGFVGLDFADPLAGNVEDILDELGQLSASLARDMVSGEDVRGRRIECRLREKLLGAVEVGQFEWTIENSQVRFDEVAARHFQLQAQGGEVMLDGVEWWKSHVHPDDLPRCEAELEKFFQRREASYLFAYRFSRDRKHYRPFLECGIPSKFGADGSIAAVNAYLVDLSRLPLADIPLLDEEEQRRHNCLRGDLLASISHELRSPLHLLENLLEERIAEVGAAGTEWHDFRGLVGEIGEKIGDIIKLSDHLYRAESLVLSNFAPRRMMKKLRDDEAIATVRMEGEAPSLVSGDFGKMLFIVRGFAQELQRQREGGKIDLRFSGEVKGANSWHLECRMLAPDMERQIDLRDSLSNLFRPRQDPIRSRSPGLGVRVALSLERLQLLGGEVEVFEDSPETGLRISFPLTVIDWTEPNDQVDPGEKLRVLVVEDHALMAKILMRGLANQSPLYDCSWASNGREALEWCRDNQADFILLDLQMPVMDGFEFLEEMDRCRDEIQWPRQGIVITSALIGKEHTDRLKTHDTLGFFEKPFDVKVLHRFLEARAKELSEDGRRPVSV